MYNKHKFKTLVHYICAQRADDPFSLGATKLNKILWLSDFRAYYVSGESITGARYVKRQFGPVPHQIVPVLKELESEGAIEVKDVFHFGKPKKEYQVKYGTSIEHFPEDQQEIIEWAIKLVCDRHTAASISNASHDHIWKAAEDGEEIPYHTVFAEPGQITEDELEWARMQLERA
jgi:Protein of unknown function (DUF4065)